MGSCLRKIFGGISLVLICTSAWSQAPPRYVKALTISQLDTLHNKSIKRHLQKRRIFDESNKITEDVNNVLLAEWDSARASYWNCWNYEFRWSRAAFDIARKKFLENGIIIQYRIIQDSILNPDNDKILRFRVPGI